MFPTFFTIPQTKIHIFTSTVFVSPDTYNGNLINLAKIPTATFLHNICFQRFLQFLKQRFIFSLQLFLFLLTHATVANMQR
jgi:hypothetical protein